MTEHLIALGLAVATGVLIGAAVAGAVLLVNASTDTMRAVRPRVPRKGRIPTHAAAALRSSHASL
jgi:hypothetical protein